MDCFSLILLFIRSNLSRKLIENIFPYCMNKFPFPRKKKLSLKNEMSNSKSNIISISSNRKKTGLKFCYYRLDSLESPFIICTAHTNQNNSNRLIKKG